MLKLLSNKTIAVFYLVWQLVFLISCNPSEAESNTMGEIIELEPSKKQISKIEISQFGKITQLKMNYSKDAVNIEFEPYQGNVEARVEFNDQEQIREIISGPSRIQYLYDEKNLEIGIFANSGDQQIMFKYEGEDIVNQFTMVGNDTVAKFRYEYQNGLPSSVEVVGAYPYFRKYKLEYTDIDNSLSGFNELILPSELIALLGIPAMYGNKYLKSAVRIDAQANKNRSLQESYTPAMEEIRFDIVKSGNHETLKLTTDGSRQWSAVIHW